MLVQLNVCYSIANNLPDLFMSITDLSSNTQITDPNENIFKIPKLLKIKQEQTEEEA